MNTRLKQIRKDAKLTQAEFGNKLDMARNFIYMMEAGKQPISNRTISDVCRIFGVREEWFRTGEEPMYIANSQTAAAIDWAMSTLTGEDTAQRRFLEALSKVPIEHWDIIESFMKNMAAQGEDGKK